MKSEEGNQTEMIFSPFVILYIINLFFFTLFMIQIHKYPQLHGKMISKGPHLLFKGSLRKIQHMPAILLSAVKISGKESYLMLMKY